MIGFWNYTVIATYASVCAATVGIWLARKDMVFYALLCLMLCGFLDMFDGKIARTRKRTQAEKRFGIQIDSLSDLIAFGVLPAAIGFSLGRETASLPVVMISVFYVLMALVRLGYFNVTEELRQTETTELRKEYLGLPVTSAALVFPLAFCFAPLFRHAFVWFYLTVMTLVGICFVLPFHLRKAGTRMMILMTAMGVLLGVFLVMQRLGWLGV